jgi:hypothetical protein
MRRLLAIAEFVCGPGPRTRVFEPLLADWQRQLADAVHQPAIVRTRIIVSGSLAFGVSISRCAMSSALSLPPGRALARGAAVFAVTIVAMLVAQGAIRYWQTLGTRIWFDRPPEFLFLETLTLALPLAVPLAMLPLMMQLRRDGRFTGWHAAQCLVAGSVLAFFTAGWATPLIYRPLQDAALERSYQRSLENDRAGRFTYPGTAVRQARPTTLEERNRAREEFRQFAATQTFPQMTRTLRTDQSPMGQSISRVLAWHAILRAPILAFALGLMGWSLAGLGRTSLGHAAMWWGLVWFAVMMFEGRLAYLGNDLMFRRLPAWLPTILFIAAAIALQIRSARTLRRA